MERGKDGWKDGQTLFCRTLPAEVGDPILIKVAILLKGEEDINSK